MQVRPIRTLPDERDLSRLADHFESRPTEELLAWAVERFGDGLTQACSFGLEDVALVDLRVRVDPDPDIFWLNTGFLFPETLETRDRLAAHYRIAFREIRPTLDVAEQSKIFGEELFRRAPGQCCWLRKVEPLRRALAGREAWITGIRRDQAPTRANARVIEWDGLFGLVKINPLAACSWEDVDRYVRSRGVPKNPLHDRGYPSIGCAPCTSPVAPGEDPRSGRWRGIARIECGLHAANGGT
jgi:phosphoadenosine phosphosulfate reductase